MRREEQGARKKIMRGRRKERWRRKRRRKGKSRRNKQKKIKRKRRRWEDCQPLEIQPIRLAAAAFSYQMILTLTAHHSVDIRTSTMEERI